MQHGAEIWAKVNKHGAKSLETQATSDNVQYDYCCLGCGKMQRNLSHEPECVRRAHEINLAYGALLAQLAVMHDLPLPDPSRLSPAPNNEPQASLTPTSGIQDDDC